MLVRRELAGDEVSIRAVTAAAFARPGEDVPVEAPLVDWLRASPAWIPELSLVAVDPDGDLAGHVLCTRGTVAASAVLALGPLSVRPDRQRSGVGQALMHAVLGAADALGEPLVVLLGSTGVLPAVRLPPGERVRHHAAAPRVGRALPGSHPHRLRPGAPRRVRLPRAVRPHVTAPPPAHRFHRRARQRPRESLRSGRPADRLASGPPTRYG